VSRRLRQRRSRLLAVGMLAFALGLVADQLGPDPAREIVSAALMAAAACSFVVFVLLELRRVVRPHSARRSAPAVLAHPAAAGSSPAWPRPLTRSEDRPTERRLVSPIPFICHDCGAGFSMTTRALTLVDCELDCPECGSPAVQADLLYPVGHGPRLIGEPEAEAS
jgi:hypothetical protein